MEMSSVPRAHTRPKSKLSPAEVQALVTSCPDGRLTLNITLLQGRRGRSDFYFIQRIDCDDLAYQLTKMATWCGTDPEVDNYAVNLSRSRCLQGPSAAWPLQAPGRRAAALLRRPAAMTTFTRPKLTAEAYATVARATMDLDAAYSMIGPFDGFVDPAVLLAVRLARTLLRQQLDAQPPPPVSDEVDLGEPGKPDGPATDVFPPAEPAG
jgi:hypothetical protein